MPNKLASQILISADVIKKQINLVFAIDSKVTFTQYQVLCAISNCGNNCDDKISQLEIAQMLNVTEGAVSRHIENLQNLNLIEREVNQFNRRKHSVKATKQGLEVLAISHNMYNQAVKEITNHLSIEDVCKLEDLLRQFLAGCHWANKKCNK